MVATVVSRTAVQLDALLGTPKEPTLASSPPLLSHGNTIRSVIIVVALAVARPGVCRRKRSFWRKVERFQLLPLRGAEICEFLISKSFTFVDGRARLCAHEARPTLPILLPPTFSKSNLLPNTKTL